MVRHQLLHYRQRPRSVHPILAVQRGPCVLRSNVRLSMPWSLQCTPCHKTTPKRPWHAHSTPSTKGVSRDSAHGVQRRRQHNPEMLTHAWVVQTAYLPCSRWIPAGLALVQGNVVHVRERCRLRAVWQAWHGGLQHACRLWLLFGPGASRCTRHASTPSQTSSCINLHRKPAEAVQLRCGCVDGATAGVA